MLDLEQQPELERRIERVIALQPLAAARKGQPAERPVDSLDAEPLPEQLKLVRFELIRLPNQCSPVVKLERMHFRS